MPAIVPAGIAIWSAISSAVAIVVGGVVSAITFIGSVLVSIGAFVTSAVAGVIGGMLSSLGIVGTTTVMNVYVSTGILNTVTLATYSSTFSFVTTLAAGFEIFLETIHFNELVQVHEIALLVSENYRVTMNKLFGQVAKFSSAIGAGANFVILALRNTRNLVYDTSTFLGRSWDLSELTWLQELDRFFVEIEDTANKYKNHPEELLNDLDELVVKPTVNLKANVVASLYNTIDNALDVIEDNTKQVIQIYDDIKKLYADLPSIIAYNIPDVVRDAINAIDKWIEIEYEPVINRIDRIIDVLQIDTTSNKNRVEDILDKIKKPGDWLSSLPDTPPEQKDRQREKVASLVTSGYENAVDKISTLKQPSAKRLSDLFYHKPTSLPPVKILTLEPVFATALPPQEIKKGSWFVGDY